MKKAAVGVGGAAALVALSAAPAFAAISSPSNGFTPVVDVNGNPIDGDITITSSGWTPGFSVFVEICDGESETAAGWSPYTDCDNYTSPSAAIADSNGDVTFNGSNSNYAVKLFRGEGPKDLFNCLAPNDDPNGSSANVPNAANQADVATIDPFEPSWGASTVGASGGGTAPCQIRLAYSKTAYATSDQLISFDLAQNGTSSATTALPESPLTIALPVGAVALFGVAGILLFHKRRSSTAA